MVFSDLSHENVVGLLGHDGCDFMEDRLKNMMLVGLITILVFIKFTLEKNTDSNLRVLMLFICALRAGAN